MIENFFKVGIKKWCSFFVSPKGAEKPKNNPTGQHGITPFNIPVGFLSRWGSISKIKMDTIKGSFLKFCNF